VSPVAIPAKQSVSVAGKTLAPQFGIDFAVDLFPVLGASAFDVINSEEGGLGFSAADASAAVCGQDLIAKFGVCTSGKLAGSSAVGLAPSVPIGAELVSVSVSALAVPFTAAWTADVPATDC